MSFAIAIVLLLGSTATTRAADIEPPQVLAAVDAASVVPDGPLAPGSLVSLFGVNLASSEAVNAELPLPTVLADAEIYVNGELARLLFVSANQVNFQLPYGLGGDSASIVASRNGALSQPLTIQLIEASPAIFTLDGTGAGPAAALRSGGILVTADDPVEPGEILTLFANGLGEVEPSVASGEPAPSTPPLARVTAELTVTFDGEPAEVLFAGLAPGFVGLYQLNVRVSAGAAQFPTVQIRMAGAASNLALIGSPGASAPKIETGTHWVQPEEFQQIAALELDFVIVTVNENPDDWDRKFNAAQDAGLKLIVGMFPEPYRLLDGSWTISEAGRSFLQYAASRAELVKGIFVYNEPYWVDPFTRLTNLCGALSAAELRALRTEIRKVWPNAKIFQDIGLPEQWVPGGHLTSEIPCLGDRFADQRGVADLVGVFNHDLEIGKPFDLDATLALFRAQVEFVENEMGAEAVIGQQAFGCLTCDTRPIRMPTPEEFRSWQCALRTLEPYGISFYPWRLDIYEEVLADRPDLWQLMQASDCDAE